MTDRASRDVDCQLKSCRVTSVKEGIELAQALADILRSALCCHSNEIRAPIANPPSSAQLGGTSYHTRSYIRLRAVVWAYGNGQTDRQTRVTNTFRVVYDSREM